MFTIINLISVQRVRVLGKAAQNKLSIQTLSTSQGGGQMWVDVPDQGKISFAVGNYGKGLIEQKKFLLIDHKKRPR